MYAEKMHARKCRPGCRSLVCCHRTNCKTKQLSSLQEPQHSVGSTQHHGVLQPATHTTATESFHQGCLSVVRWVTCKAARGISSLLGLFSRLQELHVMPCRKEPNSTSTRAPASCHKGGTGSPGQIIHSAPTASHCYWACKSQAGNSVGHCNLAAHPCKRVMCAQTDSSGAAESVPQRLPNANWLTGASLCPALGNLQHGRQGALHVVNLCLTCLQ